MIKVYGYSDDLVEIEGGSKEEEIDCYDQNVRIWFVDGTVILVSYGKNGMGIWNIEVEQKGRAPQKIISCDNEDSEIYSDIFSIAASVQKYEVVDK